MARLRMAYFHESLPIERRVAEQLSICINKLHRGMLRKNAYCAARCSGSQTSSPSRKATYSPVATPSPAFRAALTPMLDCRM